MDISEARDQLVQQKITVSDVLKRYVEQHGCPCHWPQFEYWASKPQGPGWQDNIQNNLVEAARKLSTFHQAPSQPTEYGHESNFTCAKCGSEWGYFSEEWRMLAYHERFIPLKPSTSTVASNSPIDANYFGTVGLEPRNVRLLSLTEWAEFMLGEPYHPPLGRQTVSRKPHGSLSSIRHLAAWFKKQT